MKNILSAWGLLFKNSNYTNAADRNIQGRLGYERNEVFSKRSEHPLIGYSQLDIIGSKILRYPELLPFMQSTAALECCCPNSTAKLCMSQSAQMVSRQCLTHIFRLDFFTLWFLHHRQLVTQVSSHTEFYSFASRQKMVHIEFMQIELFSMSRD